MIEKFYVYRHRRLDNGQVFYIGIANNLNRPYSIHQRNKHWKHTVAKAGFEVEILHICSTWEDVCEVEQLLISYYGRRDLGTGILVNMTDGGEGTLGTVICDSTREKLKVASRGRLHSEESRLKISKSRKGIIFSEAHLKSLSESHKGKTPSKETRLKMSEKGKGKVIKDSTKIILKSQREVPVIMLPYGIMFKSIMEASMVTGAMNSHIGQVCKGKRKTAGGFTWKYI